MHVLLAVLIAISQAQRMQIDAIVERVMRDRSIAGLSLGIARAGTALYVNGYGYDVVRRRPVDERTIYPIGSLTKQFTAALTLQDAAAGRIDLNGSVRRYLPSADPALQPITVAQLLAQTSGLASNLSAAPPAPAGTSWRYDNVNYIALGEILHRVDGADFCALLRARIASPLSLRSTRCAHTDSASGMQSNVVDMLMWLQALRAGRIVSATALSQMTESALLVNGVPANYGFGFFTPHWFGFQIAAHPGYVDGFSSADALVLDDGLQVVILSNGTAADLMPLLESLIGIIDRPLDPNLTARPNQPPQNENPTVTGDLRSILSTPAYASMGRLVQIEFVERTRVGDATQDRYRVTFSSGQHLVTILYRADLTIESVSLSTP